jgi:methionyl aminopeptidase
MKIKLKSKKEIAQLAEGGKILVEALGAAAARAREGAKEPVSTWELNKIAEKIIRKYQAEPSFLGYANGGKPFPAALCVSLNSEIVHGVPDKKRFLKEGDLVKLDLGVKFKNLYTDAAITVAVGKTSKVAQELIRITKRSLELGLEQIYPGSFLGNYGQTIERYAAQHQFFVVRGLVGHGVGYAVHEPPQVPNFGKIGEGVKLKEGMVLALEPMINESTSDIKLAADGLTFETKDGGLSAHFECTVAITKKGHRVLTNIWSLA